MNQISKVRDLMRIVAATSSVLLAMGAGSAFADTSVSGSNELTGPNSNNKTEVDVENDFDLNHERNADVYNWFTGIADTGLIDIYDTTSAGKVVTGDVIFDIATDNNVNSSGGYVGLGLGGGWGGDVDADFSNDTTGPNSNNEHKLDVDNDVDINHEKNAHINNDSFIYATTGGVNVDGVTTQDGIETGDIRVIQDISNTANQGGGIGLVGGGLGGGGDVTVSGENHLTGPHSDNTTEVDVDNDVDINDEANADINNNNTVIANTGGVNVSDTTTQDGIKTGGVGVRMTINNEAN